MSNPTELPDLDRIANDLESEAIPYEGDFADAVRAAIEDIREVASARRAQPEGEAPQAVAVCTCPSGDGSLRWPCPVHPPAAQLDGGQEGNTHNTTKD